MFVLITYMSNNELSDEKNEPFLAEILEILIIIWYNYYSKNTPIKLIGVYLTGKLFLYWI